MKHEILQRMGACADGAAYAEKYKSLKTAWRYCQRGDWMLWLARELKIDHRVLIGAAGECAATVKRLMKDPRSIAALEACEAYSQGKISSDGLCAATEAAKAAYAAAATVAAAYAAYAAYAAAKTAYAAAATMAAAKAAANAANAANEAAAANAANAAVYAADAYAAYAAAAAAANAANEAAAADDAEKKTQRQTADICRKRLTELVYAALDAEKGE